MSDKVQKLFDGFHPHIDALYGVLKDSCYERGIGVLPLASVIGVLALLQQDLLLEALERKNP